MNAIYSMTGYGEATEAVGAGLQLRLDLKSVNSRFLDLQFRLPDELRAAEGALRALLGAQLRRGKVECRINLDGAAAGSLPSSAAIDTLLQAETQLRQRAPQLAGLSVAEVWKLAGQQQALPAAEDLMRAAQAAATAALEQLQQSRAAEGDRLRDFLLTRCAELELSAQAAAKLVPQAVSRQQQRFVERWHEALAALGGDARTAGAQERMLQEAAAYALRIDVAEECSRLQSHLDAIRALLAGKGERGKRLDFLIQELHREANTLGSKSALIELSELAVDMKVCIEQMREQVQNLE